MKYRAASSKVTRLDGVRALERTILHCAVLRCAAIHKLHPIYFWRVRGVLPLARPSAAITFALTVRVTLTLPVILTLTLPVPVALTLTLPVTLKLPLSVILILTLPLPVALTLPLPVTDTVTLRITLLVTFDQFTGPYLHV